MNSLLPILLSWMQQSGYPVLWLCIFVAAIGIPLPVSLVLLAAGAFAALGDFNIFLLGVIALTAAICGDSVGYLIGRLVGVRIFAWLERPHRFNLISAPRLQKAHRYFSRYGGWAIFLSRFIVSALGGTINLLAGAEVYPYLLFLVFDISGEAAGVVIILALGYTFGASWEAIGDVIGTASLFILAFLIALYLASRLIRILYKMKKKQDAQEKNITILPITAPTLRERPDSLPL